MLACIDMTSCSAVCIVRVIVIILFTLYMAIYPNICVYIMLYVLCSWEKVLKVGKDYPVKYDNYLIILMTYPLNSLHVYVAM